MAPKERVVYIKRSRRLFWNLWWGTIRLRGLRSLFSLKDCTAFRIYTARTPCRCLNGSADVCSAQNEIPEIHRSDSTSNCLATSKISIHWLHFVDHGGFRIFCHHCFAALATTRRIGQNGCTKFSMVSNINRTVD